MLVNKFWWEQLRSIMHGAQKSVKFQIQKIKMQRRTVGKRSNFMNFIVAACLLQLQKKTFKIIHCGGEGFFLGVF